MWSAAANWGFLGLAFCLYFTARRRRAPGGKRTAELYACALIALLTFGGLLLAQIGTEASWTGHAKVTDLRPLLVASVFVVAVLLAHLLLRLQSTGADQLVLPVAASLTVLGLINIYVWETRDGNAYISTVALPRMRAYVQSVAANHSIPQSRRTAILAALGPIPNELTYERDSTQRGHRMFATVLNRAWLDQYNASASRFEHIAGGTGLHVHAVHIGAAFRKQVFVAAASVLLLPLVLFLTHAARAPPLLRRSRSLVALTLLLVAVSTAALSRPGKGHQPALLWLGGHSVIAYEVLKLVLVVVLALALGRLGSGPRRSPGAAVLFALAAAVASVAGLVWRDHGSGLALVAVCVLMGSLVVGRRRRFQLMVAVAFAAFATPMLVASLGAAAPETVRAREAMWADPWGTYRDADVANQVAASFHRLVDYRTPSHTASRVIESRGYRPATLASAVGRDVGHIKQEFRWRLAALNPSGSASAKPFIPRNDPVDESVLLEAENLWSGLGGYGWDPQSAGALRSFESVAGTALARLRTDAERLQAPSASGHRPDPLRPASAVPDNFQLQRSLYALRAGGALGRGLGRGRPEAVPGLTEDVPLAALGESLGLAGVVLIALLLLLLVTRGIEWAQTSNDRVRGLLLAGLATSFGLQGLVSLGGTSGVLPFTGLTFPFISRSGTSLVANFIAAALMLAIAEPVERGVPRQWRWRTTLFDGAGFPAAIALLVGSIAVLQLGGRTLTPGSLLSALPSSGTPLLHAADQWGLPNYRMVPGPIVDRRGRILAETRTPGGKRMYPENGLARSLGHSLLALDLAYRARLIRPTHSTRWNGGAQTPPLGPTLVTTIDSGIQRALDRAFDVGAAQAGLADVKRLRGAVVVLDTRTGAILALASRPSFSLGELSDPRVWARAEASDRRHGFPYRYLNRAIHGYYPPGSIFKTVTATAALDTGLHTLTSRDFDYRSGPLGPRPPDGLLQLGRWQELALSDGPPITDGNHPNLPLDQWNFSVETAFAWSSNIAFAQMGLELRAPALVDYSRRYGFERPLTVPGLGSSLSTVDNYRGIRSASRYVARTSSALARSAFGQGQVRATPLQMALVPAGIANGGKIMQPYIVAGWKDPDGRWTERTRPRVFSDLGLKRKTAADLQRMMRYSATYGWARRAKVNQLNKHPGVAGKTGSAEWSKSKDLTHAWFIGYIPTESPRVAIAVIVERAGAGPKISVRIAHELFASRALRDYAEKASRR